MSASALYEFFGGFGLPAYPAHNVPGGAALPYLTYEVKDGFFGGDPVSLAVNLWYYTASEALPNAKAREIGKAIGPGGVQLPCGDGTLWLTRGDPWCLSPASQGDLRQRVLNLRAEFFVMG